MCVLERAALSLHRCPRLLLPLLTAPAPVLEQLSRVQSLDLIVLADSGLHSVEPAFACGECADPFGSVSAWFRVDHIRGEQVAVMVDDDGEEEEEEEEAEQKAEFSG